MDVPIHTIDFIKMLHRLYPDVAEFDPKVVNTPEFWMEMGVIKLLREVEYNIKQKGLEYSLRGGD